MSCNNILYCLIEHSSGERYVISPNNTGNPSELLIYNDKTFLNNKLNPIKCNYDEIMDKIQNQKSNNKVQLEANGSNSAVITGFDSPGS